MRVEQDQGCSHSQCVRRPRSVCPLRRQAGATACSCCRVQSGVAFLRIFERCEPVAPEKWRGQVKAERVRCLLHPSESPGTKEGPSSVAGESESPYVCRWELRLRDHVDAG